MECATVVTLVHKFTVDVYRYVNFVSDKVAVHVFLMCVVYCLKTFQFRFYGERLAEQCKPSRINVLVRSLGMLSAVPTCGSQQFQCESLLLYIAASSS